MEISILLRYVSRFDNDRYRISTKVENIRNSVIRLYLERDLNTKC